MARTPFSVDEYVRWSHVDYAGIIFYGAYVRFFEIAETAGTPCDASHQKARYKS